MLISVTGPRDMKLPLQGLPRPLLLKLHRESTFTDLEYLAGQVFRFTYMSWRRPYPSRTPVTILYSDLIAGLLGHLRHVRNWNADIVSSPALRDKQVVPVTAPPTIAALATAYASSWLAAAAQRIATADRARQPRRLLARYFLGGTTVPGLDPDSSRLSAQWLEENRDRLGQAPVIAAIGYGLAGAVSRRAGQRPGRAGPQPADGS